MGKNYDIEQELYRIIAYRRVGLEVERYIWDSLANLEIEITSENASNVSSLVKNKKLEGYCWETTEAMSVFFEDAYIVRGFLLLGERKYCHAWLVLPFEGDVYVFDPTMDVLVLKKDFDEVFKVKELAMIPSHLVHDGLIKVLKGDAKREIVGYDDDVVKEMVVFGSFFANASLKLGRNVLYSDDISACFYHNTSAYKGEIQNNKIKSLRVHFY